MKSGFLRPIVRTPYRLLTSLFVDPRGMFQRWRGLPYFARNAVRYSRQAARTPFQIRGSDLFYTSYERFLSAGAAYGHYFHQDLWAARHVYDSRSGELVDVGSRIDGFVAHVLPFAHVRYVDIRPLPDSVENLEYVPGSILELPFEDDSVPLLSCLHVIEHIGLGRYSDPIDAAGHAKAARELVRVLAPDGVLLLGTPVGHERVVFDAHRVFDPQTIVDSFAPLQLAEFSLIDDSGKTVITNATFEQARACDYGCGLFVLKK